MILYISPEGNDRAPGSPESPLKTLEAALDRIRNAETGFWDGGAEILLHGGRYPVEKTIDISTRAPLSIRAYEGETPVLDGGRIIEGLTEGELNGMRCWTAELPAVKKGEWFFKSLFANGRRCVRAYLPRNDFYWIKSTADPEATMSADLFYCECSFFADPADLKPFRNPTDVEMHVFHYWVDEHMPAKSIDCETGRVVSTHRSVFALKDDFKPRFAKYRIEHIFEGLCEPGDFYLDRGEGRLYYLPTAEETLENTVLTAPVVEQLLRVHDASDLTLEGLAFRHTDWSLPERIGRTFSHIDDGMPYASSPQAASSLPGALNFVRSKRCGVVNCEISHTGTYAIDLEYACSSMRIQHNRLFDLGAGGVKINGATAREPVCDRSHHIMVADNDIGFGGRVFLAGVGVASLHAHNIVIAHNHIHDLYYTGVSCGWQWDYSESVCRDNIIEFNHIHCLGHGILSDMGGVYTLSVQPGTVIRNNLIYDIEKSNYGGWAIYPDEGSSHILIENNICYDTSSSCFHQHYGRENIVRNNIWAFGREGIIAYSRNEPHCGFTFEHNIVLTRKQPVYTGGGVGNIRADMNLFWDMDGEALTYAGEVFDCTSAGALSDLKQKGYDLFSIVADPGFADAAHGDFSLPEDSPAWQIGFKPIDLSTVGPRPR